MKGVRGTRKIPFEIAREVRLSHVEKENLKFADLATGRIGSTMGEHSAGHGPP